MSLELPKPKSRKSGRDARSQGFRTGVYSGISHLGSRADSGGVRFTDMVKARKLSRHFVSNFP
jgi:hypothetical protein